MPATADSGRIHTYSEGGRDMSNQSLLLGQVLCWLGFHDFRVIEKTFGFGDGGGVEKDECRRCGTIRVRQC